MFLRNFEPPKAVHMETWFLSVFGCPYNSIIEGGLGVAASGYGAGGWVNFFNTADRQDVVDYILTETLTRPADFLDHPNYPRAPSIIRKIDECEQNLTNLQNQMVSQQTNIADLQTQNTNLQTQVTNLQNQVTDLQNQLQTHQSGNNFMAETLILALLKYNGPSLIVSNPLLRGWYEARKNGGGGGGKCGIGGVGDGKNGDGKNGDGKNGADGADGADVVIPCPEPVVCNIAKIQIQLNSTIKSLDECKKQKDQTNDDLNVCKSHKDEIQDWLTDCQKEYVKQTSHSSKDDTLISLRNCQAEYRKETFKKDKLCRGLSKHIIGYLDFCEDKVEKLRLANCE
ncbi:hypothetical protein ACTFIT_008167 [Dictyostelium discoideum]